MSFKPFRRLYFCFTFSTFLVLISLFLNVKLFFKFQPVQEQQHLEAAIVATDSVDPQKDTEAYCEKICANVYDENDEIVCGSDGYMYTGESQLQCYSSCLNIGKFYFCIENFLIIQLTLFIFHFLQRCR